MSPDEDGDTCQCHIQDAQLGIVRTDSSGQVRDVAPLICTVTTCPTITRTSSEYIFSTTVFFMKTMPKTAEIRPPRSGLQQWSAHRYASAPGTTDPAATLPKAYLSSFGTNKSQSYKSMGRHAFVCGYWQQTSGPCLETADGTRVLLKPNVTRVESPGAKMSTCSCHLVSGKGRRSARRIHSP